jgi:predicted nucleotidyltransferase
MVPSKLSLKSLTQRLVRCLESRGVTVDKLYLYGSYARDRATADSDIDVLLVSPTLSGKSFWARCVQVGEALSGLAEPVQVYPVTPDEMRNPEAGGFLMSVGPELKLLYQKNRRHPALGTGQVRKNPFRAN